MAARSLVDSETDMSLADTARRYLEVYDMRSELNSEFNNLTDELLSGVAEIEYVDDELDGQDLKAVAHALELAKGQSFRDKTIN